MKDIVGSFRERYRQECAKGDTNRALCGRTVLGFIDGLERESVERKLGPGRRCEWSNFTEDFEAIVSFIDLNVGRTIETRIKGSAGEESSPSMDNPFSPHTNLLEIRNYIATYLRLVLGEPSTTNGGQIGRFADCLAAGDNILTFNYDLVVETELWRRRQWSPVDGYGVKLETPPVRGDAVFVSNIHVFKLHGSLNWRSPGFFQQPIRLEGFHDNGEPIFPEYLADETTPYEYEGGHAPCWVMPSFIKNFAVPELLRVWECGQNALRTADEVIVIGYSLPEADSAASLLLGTTGLAQKRLIIVDPNVKALQSKFARITGNRDTVSFNTFDEFVNAYSGEAD